MRKFTVKVSYITLNLVHIVMAQEQDLRLILKAQFSEICHHH